MGLTDERKTNNNKTVQKTTGDGNTDGQTGGNTGSGSGEGTKTNANWPDFSKLTRVQDVLDRNKCVLVMFVGAGPGVVTVTSRRRHGAEIRFRHNSPSPTGPPPAPRAVGSPARPRSPPARPRPLSLTRASHRPRAGEFCITSN